MSGEGAPGQDEGTDLGSSYNTDKLGTSRPQGSGWDMGAYEYEYSAAIEWNQSIILEF